LENDTEQSNLPSIGVTSFSTASVIAVMVTARSAAAAFASSARDALAAQKDRHYDKPEKRK